MDKILNYQISMFGYYEDFKATTDKAKTFLEVLKDFLPSTISLASIDLKTNSVNFDNRLQLVSNDQTIIISFLPDRIDVNYNNNSKKEGKTKFEDILEMLIKIINKVKETIPQIKGYRVATNCNVLSKTYNEKDMEKIIYMYSNGRRFFDTNGILKEWSQRYNNQYNEQFNEKTEITNHIFSIEKNSTTNQFVLLYDINTIPQNQTIRFSFDDLIEFSICANKKISSYFNAFEQ